MTHRRIVPGLVAIAVLAACSSKASDKVEPTVARDRHAWPSADRTTYVVERGEALAVVRGTATLELPLKTGCLTQRPDTLIVSTDGARAIAIGWKAPAMACALDLLTGKTRPLTEAFAKLPAPARPNQVSSWLLGAGLLYGVDQKRAHDGKDVADLPIELRGTCSLVERATAATIACVRAEETGPGLYVYKIETTALDTSVFPPVAVPGGAHVIDVTRAEHVRLSRDGKRLAWWYRPPDGPSSGGIVEVETGKQLAALDGPGIVGVDFDPKGTTVVVLQQPRSRGRDAGGTLAFAEIGPEGFLPGKSTLVETTDPLNDVAWLSDGGVLVMSPASSQVVRANVGP